VSAVGMFGHDLGLRSGLPFGSSTVLQGCAAGRRYVA
jgi:hypothetical protein